MAVVQHSHHHPKDQQKGAESRNFGIPGPLACLFVQVLQLEKEGVWKWGS